MADVNANIGVHIDTSATIAKLKALRAEISRFNQSVSKSSAAAALAQRDLQTNLLNAINATGKFHARMGLIRTSTESFTHALETNKLSMREYFRYAGGASTTFRKLFAKEFQTIQGVAESRVKQLQTQYIKLGRDASGAMKAISITPTTLNMKDYGTQVAIAAQRQAILNQLLKQGSTNLLNFGKNTQWAGRQLMVGFTIPLAYFGTAASKTFMDLEAQAIKFRRVYGEMFTTTEQTNKALADIQALAQEFTKYGVAVTKTMEMAASAAAMGKMGADLTAQVAQATRLAVLGAVEQEQALETTISLTNAFGIAAEDLTNKIDFLNAVENQTVVAIEDLTIAIPKAGPVVKQLGGDVEDLAFFLTAMKEGGINASQGANALKSGLASLINPTDKAKEMLMGFGINIDAIVEGNAGNLRQTVIDFAKALDTLDPLNRARAIEQLFGKFQFARLSTLFQNVTKDGTQASRVLDLAGKSVEELAILSERELKAVEDAVGTNFRAAVEELKLAIAPIGETFLKTITPLVQGLGNILDKFNNLGDGTKRFIVIATTLVGLIGPTFLMTFGLLANGVANIIKLFALMRNGFLKLTGNSAVLAEQTNYLTKEQMEAATVAAALDQAHNKLTQRFTSEAAALEALRAAFDRATAAQIRFAAANPGMMMPGFKPGIKGGGSGTKFASGTTEVIGGQAGKDSVPALLMPGEAVVPTDIAQDERFKPIIEALVTGKIAKLADGDVNVGGRTYSARSQSAALNLQKKIAQLLGMGVSESRIIAALDKNIERGRPMTASALEKRLSIGRGSGVGTSAPTAIKRLARESQSGFRAEARAIKNVLKQKGISITPAQEKNLFSVQASHIEEVRNAGVKQWNASNLVADLGYVNNYLNTVKGNLGKNLLAMSDDQLKSLGIDRNELKSLQSGRHPTTAKAAETLRAVARYDASINPRSYQANAVLAGLEYRSKTNFYTKPLKTLADIAKVGKTPATFAVSKGEKIQTTGGAVRTVTGQTGIKKPSGMRVVGGGAADRRVISGANIASIFPRGFRGPRLVGAGAIGGYGEGASPTPVGFRGGGSGTVGSITAETRQSETRLKDSIDRVTKSNESLATEALTTKDKLRQFSQKANVGMGAVSGLTIAASFAGGKIGEMAQKIMPFVFALQGIVMLLPMLANPWMLAVAAVGATAALMYKFNKDIEKAREEGVNLAKAMSMTSEKIQALSEMTGTVSGTELAGRRRENILAGNTEAQRRFGQNIIASEFGQGMLDDINKQISSGLDTTQVSQNIANNLSQAVVQGVITTEQARSISSALGEELGSYEIPALVSGKITSLLGPNGEKLESDPLEIALKIKKESMQNTADAFNTILSQRNKTLGTAGEFAASAALVGAGALVGGPVGAAVGAGVAIKMLFDQNKLKAENAKLDSAAIQLGLEQIGQNQQLVDGINKQFDAKVKSAKTESEIEEIERNRVKAIEALNKENATTLNQFIDLSEQVSGEAFTKGINSAVNRLYKDSSTAIKTFANLAKDQLSDLEDSPFKKTIQIGFASGELDPSTVLQILKLSAEDEDIDQKINLLIQQQGFADANLLMQLFAKTGAGAETIDLMLNYVNENDVAFDKDVNAVAAIANMQGTYGVTLDLTTNGLQQIQGATTALDAIKDLPDKLDFTLIQKLAGENPAVFKGIEQNWKDLSEGKDTIDKNLVVNYTIGNVDPNLQAAAAAEKISVPQYIAKGFITPTTTTTTTTTDEKDKKDRDTTLDNLLTRLKFIREASINAQGGVKELLRITSGKGLANFGGVIQQLIAGPKGGASREFISFLEGLDNKQRKVYATVKNGQVVLTKQGKALKEAFNEATIGEFQVAQRQALQDTKAQSAALRRLAALGIDSSTALEMVADANLAVAINSKSITGKEIKNMAAQAKAAKDEMKALNLEVLNLADNLRTQVGDASNTLKALAMAREAGITDADLLETISKDMSIVNKILSDGIGNETVQSIISATKALKQLEDQTSALINPAEAAMQTFLKLKDAAFKMFDQQERAAQTKFNSAMSTTVSSMSKFVKLPERFQGLSLKDAIAAAEKEIQGLNDQIQRIQDLSVRPIDIEIDAKESAIDDIMSALESQAAGMQRGFNLPPAAYKDVAEGLRDQINEMELDLEFNPNYGARLVEQLQDQVSDLELEIELNFSRPIADLQEESSDLSNDLTLMDRIADQITEKYNAQAEALENVANANQEILNQQKSQLDIASALTQGDIAAAARAAQEARSQAASAAAQRAGGVLDAARQAELAGIRSAGGMTREQIEERQFEISQQIYQLEEQSEIRQRSILAIQDQIRSIEEIRTQKQREIRDIQDELASGERAREAFLRENVLPIENQIKALQEQKAIYAKQIQDLETQILAMQYEILDPLQQEADLIAQELQDTIDKIELERQYWEERQIALEEATTATEALAAQAQTAQAAFEAAKAAYDGINSKDVTIRITEIVTRIVNEVSGTTTSKDGVFDPSAVAGKMYGGKIKGYMGGGRVRPLYRPMGGLIPYMADGGFRPMGSDTVPAMLTPGEYVVNKASTKAFLPFLSAINESKYPSMIARKMQSAAPVMLNTSLVSPSYNVSTPNISASATNIANASYSDNSNTVYNYSVGISVGGTNASPDSIAQTVMNEIKYLDSQRVRKQRVS